MLWEQVILNILEAKLVSIQMMWRERVLQRCGLSSGEVRHLICALFEDTDLRRDVLSGLNTDT